MKTEMSHYAKTKEAKLSEKMTSAGEKISEETVWNKKHSVKVTDAPLYFHNPPCKKCHDAVPQIMTSNPSVAAPHVQKTALETHLNWNVRSPQKPLCETTGRGYFLTDPSSAQRHAYIQR